MVGGAEPSWPTHVNANVNASARTAIKRITADCLLLNKNVSTTGLNHAAMKKEGETK